VKREKVTRWNVYYVWPYLSWGGAQIYFMGIMKHIREDFDIRAIMPRGSSEKLLGYLERIGVPCDFFDAYVDFTEPSSFMQKLMRRLQKGYCAWVLVRYLNRLSLRKTILQVDLAPWSWFGLLFFLSLRCQVFVTLHIALPRISGFRKVEWQVKFRTLSMLSNFHILVSNKNMFESLKQYVSPEFLSNVRLAYTGVDKDEIQEALDSFLDREQLCEKFSLPSDRFFVFSLGQLVSRKGALILLQAAKELHHIYPELFFVWVGDGEQRQEIIQKIENLGLEDSFRIISPSEIGPNRLDILTLLCLADTFVHPSFSEGLPGALLEAMALGKACVATCVNAIPEAVKDHETGLLVPPGDSAALAAAISELYLEPTLRTRLATAGQSYVLSHFDERSAAKITAGYYHDCLSFEKSK
jgi:glycosyltransferase involved in cell wall biosynthesis